MNKDEYRSILLSTIRNYFDKGTSMRGGWKDDREKAEHVWNAEFHGPENKRPENIFYYPIVFSRLRRNVVSLRKMYKAANDLIAITTLKDFPEKDEIKICDAAKQIMNYHLIRWNEMLPFIDDTATQGLKFGMMVAKVYWDRRTETREYEVLSDIELGEDGEGNNTITQLTEKETEEVVTHNHLCVEYIPIEDFSYDPARTFGQSRWVIQHNIPKTVDELYDLVRNEGYDLASVEKLIEMSKVQLTPENDKIFISEFWGWLPIPEEDTLDPAVLQKNVKFVQMVLNNDGTLILKEPSEETYKYLDDTPMNNYEVGYFIKYEGRIRGVSWTLLERDLQGETNTIRNQRRKMVQRVLDQGYVINKDSEFEIQKLGGSGMGDVISVNDVNGFREIRHSDNTSQSYSELEAVNQDLDKLDGMTSYALGMADPHVTDTLGGIQLMSNASNAIIFDNILGYNEFFEGLMTKALHLIIRHTTDEQFAEAGVDFSEFSRKDMYRKLKVKIDCGLGATSEAVRINNYTQAYFTTQQWVQYCINAKIEPGKGVYAPTIALRNLLPLLNTKDVAAWIPSAEELEQQSQEMLQMQQGREESEAQAEANVMQDEVQNATEAGMEQAQQEMQGGQNAQTVQ